MALVAVTVSWMGVWVSASSQRAFCGVRVVSCRASGIGCILNWDTIPNRKVKRMWRQIFSLRSLVDFLFSFSHIPVFSVYFFLATQSFTHLFLSSLSVRAP